MADETPPSKPKTPRTPRKAQSRVQKQTSSLNAFSKKATDVFAKLNQITKVLSVQQTRLSAQSRRMDKELERNTNRRIAQMKVLNDLSANRNADLKNEVNRTRLLVDTVKTLSSNAKSYAGNMEKAAKAVVAQQTAISTSAPAASKWASVLATRMKVGKATDRRDAAKGAMYGAFGAGVTKAIEQHSQKSQTAELNQMVAAYKKEYDTLAFLDREKMKAIELEKKQAAARKAAGYIPWLTTLVDKLRQVKEDKEDLDKGGFLDKVSTALHHEPGKVAAATAAGATIGAASSGLDLLKKVFFATWDYIDSKVLPTQALLNRSFGTTTKNLGELKSQAFAVGQQFQSLGYDFAQGTQLVSDLGKALFTAKISQGDLKNLLTMSEYIGLGAEQTGRLANLYMAQGKSVKQLAENFKDVAQGAMDFGVPVQGVLKEFGELGTVGIRWGTDNAREFGRAIARAQSLKIAYKDVNEVFGQNYDTFESVAKSASDLNQVFGTNLDSIKLLNASDSERFDMFQKAFRESGIVYDKLGGIQQNFIRQATHANEEQAAMFFGSETLRKSADKQATARKRSNAIDAEWSKGLENIRQQLLSMPQLLENLFVAINNVVMKFFGQENGIKGTGKFVKTFGNGVELLTKKINDFAKNMQVGAGFDSLKNFGSLIEDTASKAGLLADALYSAMNPYDSWKGKSAASDFLSISDPMKQLEFMASNDYKSMNADQKQFFNMALKEHANDERQKNAMALSSTNQLPTDIVSRMPGMYASAPGTGNAQLDMLIAGVKKLNETAEKSNKKAIQINNSVKLKGREVSKAANQSAVLDAFGLSGD